jgi:pyridoxamine 5'-phosphate oxidase
MSETKSLADLRREYTLGGLRRADLGADPILQFKQWFDQARGAGLVEPNAMTLATVGKDARPSARIVLLKAVDQRGFIFFTNYASRKGLELAENPNAALAIYWAELERQVCVGGAVAKISDVESDEYFNSRPKGSRLAAWTSSQSEVIASRTVLERKLDEISARHPGDHVPRPPYWGGYCLAPDRIEFWQGRPNRLHDRFQYLKLADGGWRLERLSP